MGDFEKFHEAFLAHTGADYADDLFMGWTKSTTRLDGFLLSPRRVATTRFDAYSVVRFGVESPIYLNVWSGMHLVETAWVPIKLLFDAMDMQGVFHEKVWAKNGEVVSVYYEPPFLNVTSFYRYGDNEETGHHSLMLTTGEFETLCERLAPLRGYIPPKKEE